MKKILLISLLFCAQLIVSAQVKHYYQIKADTIRIKKSVTPIVGSVLMCIDTFGDYVSVLDTSGGGIGIDTSHFWNTGGNAGTDPATDFVGTTDSVDLIIRTKNYPNIELLNSGRFIGIGDPEGNNNGTYIGINDDWAAKTIVFNADNNIQSVSNYGNIILQAAPTTGKVEILNSTLQITDGTQGAGKVLTSDANGSASWQTAPGGNDTTKWSINGNAGTDPAVNFIGTTDANRLNFKVNDTLSGYIDATNLALGFQAGEYHTEATGQNNIFIGYQAGQFDGGALAPTDNVAIGTHTLYVNQGNGNVAIGSGALMQNQTGNTNIGIGSNSLASNQVGNYLLGLGLNTDVLAVGLTNSAAIGYNAKIGESNAIILGDITQPIMVGIGTDTPSAMLDIENYTGSVPVGLKLSDGTQGAGKLLKSDAVGNASWTASPFVVLYSQTDTTQTVNDTTQHSLVKTGVGNMTIPANMPVGTTYQLNIRGFHSNNSFDNLVVRIKIDGTTVDSAIVTSGPGVVGGASGITANLNIYSTGNTGKYWIQGFYNEDGSTNSGMPTTSAKTLNTTTTHTVDVTIQWKTKTASDSWTVTNLTFDQRTP